MRAVAGRLSAWLPQVRTVHIGATKLKQLPADFIANSTVREMHLGFIPDLSIQRRLFDDLAANIREHPAGRWVVSVDVSVAAPALSSCARLPHFECKYGLAFHCCAPLSAERDVAKCAKGASEAIVCCASIPERAPRPDCRIAGANVLD